MDANAESGEPPRSHPASTDVANDVSAVSDNEARMTSELFMTQRKIQIHTPRFGAQLN